MPNISIPIILTPGPVAPGSAVPITDLNGLLALVCRYISGGIIADGQFIIFTPNDPATQQAPLIFNTSQQVFKVWNIGAGRYVPIFQYAYGDVKTSFAGYDTPGTGWFVLDGRAIAAIPGITFAQQSVLLTFFPSGTLPVVSPQNIAGLPANGAFSGIVWPASINPVVTPAAGVISPGLPFTGPNPSDTEVQALADATETLRGSAQDAFDVTKQIQAKAETFLEAINNAGTPPMYSLVFAGFS